MTRAAVTLSAEELARIAALERRGRKNEERAKVQVGPTVRDRSRTLLRRDHARQLPGRRSRSKRCWRTRPCSWCSAHRPVDLDGNAVGYLLGRAPGCFVWVVALAHRLPLGRD